MPDLIFRILFTVLAAAVLTVMSAKMFQMLQLSSYRTRGVFAWFRATKFDYVARYFACAFLSGAAMAMYLACFSAFLWAFYLGAAAFFLFGILFVVISRKSELQKTPLKLTKRLRRLAVVTALLNLGLVFGLLALGIPLSTDFGDFHAANYAFAALAFFLIPLTVCLAHLILLPVEKLIQGRYKAKTKKRLEANPSLIKIGITGSYGKTTAKNILCAMLSKKYRVLATPASYNTPMGICKAVGESLAADTEVFIAEMGARYRGDIAELCDLVRPQYGLITGIGSQHLETFGDEETLYKTKHELVDSLPKTGCAFFNGENEGANRMFAEYGGAKRLSVANEAIGSQAQSASVFCLPPSVLSPLLGKHIPGLIALCASVALELGVSMEQIMAAAAELKPVPHRLEPVVRGETTIIDDAYNANLDGAINALEVLGGYKDTRIVVTPGLVELGAAEERANRDFGKAIAKYADYAVLNSLRGAWIKAGALEGGMNEERIFLVADLAAATAKLGEIPGKKTILFENDLPDNLK